MTASPQDYPFSIRSDIELGARVAAAMVERDADVVVGEGEVPTSLDATVEGVAYQLRPGEFLLNVPDGSRLYVKDGRRITYQRGPATGDRDITLFILGSAWGALCYQRGLVPIHASAVLADERIYAFTGHSGAGKSTLAANLAKRGLPFFTDDTLIFDPALSSEQALCYAGQKQLKLWRDAVDEVGAKTLHRVRETNAIDKHFAVPPHPAQSTLAPLAKLFLLRRKRFPSDPDNSITPITGSEALQAFRRNLYRPTYAEALMGRKPLFLALKQLLETVQICEFARSVEARNYTASLDAMQAEIDACLQAS